MLKKTRILALVLCFAMAVSLAACSSDSGAAPAPSAAAPAAPAASADEAPAEAPAETAGLKFGWSVYDNQQEFFQSMTAGVEEKAAELGIQVILHDQQNDETEMVSGATRLINDEGVDALVISPCKPEALRSIVERAKQKSIPVIICDIGDGGTDKDAIIVSDMYGGGRMAGKYALQLLEAAGTASRNYAVIRCEASAVYAARRPEGFKDVMNEAGYTMVQELTADSDQTKGYEAMQDILAANPDIAAVFAANDPMALGAMEALQEAGRSDVLLFGFNGDAGALEAIAAGTMQGTVAQDPKGIGALGVELANTMCTGGSLAYDDATNKEIFAAVQMIGKDGEVLTDITAD